MGTLPGQGLGVTQTARGSRSTDGALGRLCQGWPPWPRSPGIQGSPGPAETRAPARRTLRVVAAKKGAGPRGLLALLGPGRWAGATQVSACSKPERALPFRCPLCQPPLLLGAQEERTGERQGGRSVWLVTNAPGLLPVCPPPGSPGEAAARPPCPLAASPAPRSPLHPRLLSASPLLFIAGLGGGEKRDLVRPMTGCPGAGGVEGRGERAPW